MVILALNSAGAMRIEEVNLKLEHTTITDNNSSNYFDAVDNQGSTISASNCIISGNNTGDDFDTLTSLGNNILGTGTVIDQNTSDIITTDPQLNPLADNGGATLTHLPMTTSPAIDAGLSSYTVDQRGVTRPQGDAVDIGSVEVEITNAYTVMPAVLYLLN